VVVGNLLPESIFALDQLSMKNMLADVTEVILSKETKSLFSLMKSKELVEESVSYLKKVWIEKKRGVRFRFAFLWNSIIF
jgi:hypothetical protein